MIAPDEEEILNLQNRVRELEYRPTLGDLNAMRIAHNLTIIGAKPNPNSPHVFTFPEAATATWMATDCDGLAVFADTLSELYDKLLEALK